MVSIFDTYTNSAYEFHGLYNVLIDGSPWHIGKFNNQGVRIATTFEQQILFDALKEKGKRWNAKTLEVENLVKKGDIVIHDNTKRISIFDSYENKYSRFNAIFSIGRSGDIDYNQSWVTDTIRYATSSEIEKFDNDLKEIGKKWNREALEIEDLDISEIVIDLESATEYLECQKYIYNADKKDKRLNKFEAQITLQLICEAWNKHDGFEVDYANSEQDKYFPVLDVYGDIKCLLSLCTTHISASCLSFPTQERAIQFGNQFKDLFKTAMGL